MRPAGAPRRFLGFLPAFLRSAERYWNYPDGRDDGLGFRLAQDLN